MTLPSSVRERRRSGSQMRDGHWLATRDEPVLSDTWTHTPSFAPYSTLTSHSRDVDDEEEHAHHRMSYFQRLKGDFGNIALLVFLYILQGIPLGLTSSIPLILQGRHVSYKDQAVFSFAYWPFSLKLFWAPLVDSIYWSRMGRRKSWLVPTQYLIALSMYILSQNVTYVLGDHEADAKPNVRFLTCIFFAFNFLAATQDIAVDGWALTMLSKRNVGFASTCNAVGQTAGWFIGNVVFLVLESKQFCNSYIFTTPRSRGLVTLSEFVYFWAILFAVSTTLVLLLKRERDVTTEDDEEDLGIVGTYKLMIKILKLKPVLMLLLIFLTGKVGFAAVDGITGLKLVEKGVPKDKLAFIAIPLVPLQIVLPWIIGKYTAGPRPMSVYLKAYPYRLVLGLLFPLVIYNSSFWQLEDKSFPFSFYVVVVMVYCVHQVAVYSNFVSTMAFSAQVSDPRVGGTYMTLLNTVNNMGGNWPVTLIMSCLDFVTWKTCTGGAESCVLDKECTGPGSSCEITWDGYYPMCVVSTVIGFLWFFTMRRKVDRLQYLDKSAWTVSRAGCVSTS